MLLQVLSLTPEQINGLAEKDRTAILALVGLTELLCPSAKLTC